MKSVLTKFGKGTKYARGLNFSLSGKDNCDDSCRQKSGACYSLPLEKMYKGYGAKLRRHSITHQHNLIYRAMNEIMSMPKLDWFRFSVAGSTKAKFQMKPALWKKYTKSLKDLCSYLVERKIPIHFPVETMGKARSLRAALRGLPVVIRRSIQSDKWQALKNSKDHVSWIAPSISDAFKTASELRKLNRTVVVCAAIKGVSKHNPSRCGKCTACASEKVDVIIYPLH